MRRPAAALGQLALRSVRGQHAGLLRMVEGEREMGEAPVFDRRRQVVGGDQVVG